METIVISVGGSVVVPDKINTKFLFDLKKIINQDKRKFIIITGGGKTCRNYIAALSKFHSSNREKDLIGIETTRLNAQLMTGLFKLPAKIPKNIREVKNSWKKQKITVCGGFRPGITTDGVAVEIAKTIGAKTFINLTNVAGVYTKDPKKKGAKLLKETSYKIIFKLLEKIKEKPGQHFILDRHAAKIAGAIKMKVIILKGLNNLKACLKNKKFTGTIIR
jgi:uridylate kinase